MVSLVSKYLKHFSKLQWLDTHFIPSTTPFLLYYYDVIHNILRE